MASIIRVSNGETIQIRSGVLQGIGPQGPTGATGPQGPMGAQGPQGDVGPMGQINQDRSESAVSTPFSVSPNTTTLLSTVTLTDVLAGLSGSTFTAPEIMDIFVFAWVRFDNESGGNTGYRSIQLVSNLYTGNTFAQTRVPAVALSAGSEATTELHTDLTVVGTLHCAAGEQVQVQVRHSDQQNVQVSAGRFSVYRIGSGPQGPQGPQGGVGLTGPQGLQGIQGPAGNASSGYTSYAGLLA